MFISKAIDTIKKAFPNNYLRGYFEYENGVVAILGSTKEWLEDDYATFFVIVDPNLTINIFEYYKELYNDEKHDGLIAAEQKYVSLEPTR